MARTVLEAFLLFALPFVLYGLALAFGRRLGFMSVGSRGRRMARLALAGLALVVMGFVIGGALAPRGTGAYRPAHVEDGRLVPGRIQ